MAVFGLVFGNTGAAEFPDVGDVRAGVDNGNGSLGTLVLPAEMDVRSGIGYGAGGNEFSGSLYIQEAASSTLTTGEDIYETGLVTPPEPSLLLATINAYSFAPSISRTKGECVVQSCNPPSDFDYQVTPSEDTSVIDPDGSDTPTGGGDGEDTLGGG